MKVWIRGRCESLIAFQAASMSALWVRERPQIDRALDLARDRLDGLEVAGRGDREAGLDHVDAEARELLGDLDLLLRVQRDARRLLAVAQRRVEDVDAVLLGPPVLHSCFPPSLETSDDLFFGLRLSRRPALTPPEGGGEGEAPGCRAGGSSK